jgi:hypothetical protein
VGGGEDSADSVQRLLSNNLSLLLAAQFIDLIQSSGATKIEAYCALDITKNLLPTFKSISIAEAKNQAQSEPP